MMSIKDRLDQVYSDYVHVSYSELSDSVRSECLECGKQCLEKRRSFYPEVDAWVECLSCGAKFDFRIETEMWIKKR